jgi:hypothetical protein
MQKGYDRNTMQCVLTLSMNIPAKLIWVSDRQRGRSRILPCFESRWILSHGRGMVVEWWNGYRVSPYESLAGQFTWVKYSWLIMPPCNWCTMIPILRTYVLFSIHLDAS